MDNFLISIDGLIARWQGQISRRTLANWRVLGRGPSYIKVGKIVLYALDSVEDFEQRSLRKISSEKASRKICDLFAT